MEILSLRSLATALVVVIIGGASVLAQGDMKSSHRTTDELMIRQNVRTMEEGWNSRSGSLFAKPFAANADYVVINGMHLSGHDEIEKGHQRIFDTVFNDSILTLSAKQIRFLRVDVALVHVSGQLKNKSGAEVRMTDVTISLVMTKDQGEWRIAGFQNTAVDKGR
ncbi:MAG TPA: SgcJ/EcaC family oxidoreductase [Pyrinomonadaceae bacterium]|nr:SgcJ/EcaC family oxidoreductase [Pyrinomonadaceae bacterium]